MIVYKNFLQLVLEKKFLALVYLCIFLFISFISLQSQESRTQAFSETPLRITIVNKAQDALSQHLISYLQTMHTVTILLPEEGNDEAMLRKLKKDISLGNIHAGIIIAEQMEQLLESGEKCVISFKDDRKQSAFYLNLQIQKFLLFASAVKKAEGYFNFEKIENALAVKTGAILSKNKKNAGVTVWFTYFFNFLGWIIFSIILNSVGRAMFDLNNPRLRIRNTIAPISTLRFVCENFAAQLTVVIIFLSALIGFAIILNLRHLNTIPLFPYIVHTLIYAAVILSITFMLNTILKKGSVMGIVGTILPLSLAFISGIFIEQEYLPASIHTIAQCFPTYYFVQANEFTARVSQIDWKNTGFLLLFLFLYFTLGMYFTKLTTSQQAIEYLQK